MKRLWSIVITQLALAAVLREVGYPEVSALALSLATTMAGWLLAERRGKDR